MTHTKLSNKNCILPQQKQKKNRLILIYFCLLQKSPQEYQHNFLVVPELLAVQPTYIYISIYLVAAIIPESWGWSPQRLPRRPRLVPHSPSIAPTPPPPPLLPFILKCFTPIKLTVHEFSHFFVPLYVRLRKLNLKT